MKRRHRILIGAASLSIGLTAAVATLNRPARPDLRLTPGTTLPVTLAQLCMPGYTTTVRVSLTPAERDQVDRAYHWTYAPGKQEYDHLVPLELGGANGVKNIWPQPIDQARTKDGLENRLHAMVCSHQITLQNAQTCIRVDWVACRQRYP